ncbi:MAG: hypothetical protein HKN12_00610 [Gemmatimonadetes bacterium]|nr:hypothetical protein [Gemmatimonadota bacterium]
MKPSGAPEAPAVSSTAAFPKPVSTIRNDGTSYCVVSSVVTGSGTALPTLLGVTATNKVAQIDAYTIASRRVVDAGTGGISTGTALLFRPGGGGADSILTTGG